MDPIRYNLARFVKLTWPTCLALVAMAAVISACSDRPHNNDDVNAVIGLEEAKGEASGLGLLALRN
ncbi:MAG TPA: hypothetical protein VME40_15790, partial [Caulobacteraceae bacterium]|nr:hypothetical protein [Caulobacteraceae bacterium]